MINVLIVIVLILFSALFSGLTLGLMSLNTYELKRKMQLGNKDAAKVYGIAVDMQEERIYILFHSQMPYFSSSENLNPLFLRVSKMLPR